MYSAQVLYIMIFLRSSYFYWQSTKWNLIGSDYLFYIEM